jgi:hypothetical protein
MDATKELNRSNDGASRPQEKWSEETYMRPHFRMKTNEPTRYNIEKGARQRGHQRQKP